MGAISDTSSIEVLKEFLNDSARCVRETCEIAISKVQWDNSEEGKEHHERLDNELRYASTLPVLLEFFFYQLVIYFSRKYTSVDPAPASSGLLRGPPKVESSSEESIENLQKQLLDKSLPLFERYRAMFALRNVGTPAAVDALASGFTDDSELFKCVLQSRFFQSPISHW